MSIIAIANHKGGCGKTTTSIHFSACLANLGKRVLLIDMDPQGHSTCGLGLRAEDYPYTLYDFLRLPPQREFQASELLCEVNPNLFILPSYGILSAIEEELAQAENKERYLQSRLEPFLERTKSFDFIILDCPPNLGLLTYNALEIADEVIIPIEPSFFSLHGLGKMMESIEATKSKLNKEIQVHALLTIFNSELSFAEEVYEEVRSHFDDQLFKSIIHDNVLFKEAASAGESIVEYAPESSALADYQNLAVEYLEKHWQVLFPEKDLGWDNVFHHRYGPKRVIGGVLFQAMSQKARWVEIAGDFNGWVPEPMIKREDDGLWQKVVPLTGGRFRYKYIIDGEWQVDPYQPQEQNDFGGTDSYLEIA